MRNSSLFLNSPLAFFLCIVVGLIFCRCADVDAEDAPKISSEYVPSVPPPGWPNSSNTGLLISVGDLRSDLSILTPVSGGYLVSTGQTIENLEVKGRLILEGDNITIRNCRIWGEDINDSIGIQIKSGINIIIENNVIGKDRDEWPNSMTGISVGSNFNVTATIESNYIRYVEDGLFIGFNPYAVAANCSYSLEIRDNYITYLCAYNPNKPLLDPAQQKADGIEALGSILQATIEHNSIEAPKDQNSCIQISPQWASISGVYLHKNWLNGGSISLRVRDDKLTDVLTISDTIVKDNRFGRSYKYGPWNNSGTIVEAITGNVWADSGETVGGMNQ